MRRRDFLTLVGSTTAWPLAARAQKGERTRRIGVLTTFAEDDPEGVARNAAFLIDQMEILCLDVVALKKATRFQFGILIPYQQENLVWSKQFKLMIGVLFLIGQVFQKNMDGFLQMF